MNNINKIIILSGGFDPLHKGHIRMFKEASKIGKVVVGLNSDNWLIRKKGKCFMTHSERTEILGAIEYIDSIVSFDDNDNTAIKLIQNIFKEYSKSAQIFFGNGGDRIDSTTPEVDYCKDNNIEMLWNLGGEKVQSSSKLLNL